MTIKRVKFSDIQIHDFDDVIDVRSPLEFEDDRIPGSINLPVLSNAEREMIGTMYKQKSKFEAKKLGASVVSKNISDHLKDYLYNKSRDWLPLIYCWRGGQRSYALATILDQIGWKVEVVDGGYKSFRKHIREFLNKNIVNYFLILLKGNTGTAKTRILNLIEERNGQIIDLESLASHKGSVFGSQGQKQPSQKLFETLIYEKLHSFNSRKNIWVEAESIKVGKLSIPSKIWKNMPLGKNVKVISSLEERVRFILKDYKYFTTTPTLMKEALKAGSYTHLTLPTNREV